MNWVQIGATFGVNTGLILFGIAYDKFVAKLEHEGSDQGFTALLVAAGVAVTLFGIGIMDLFVNLNAGLIGVMCFASSGLPMIFGSLRRYAKLRSQFKKALDLILGGNWK